MSPNQKREIAGNPHYSVSWKKKSNYTHSLLFNNNSESKIFLKKTSNECSWIFLKIRDTNAENMKFGACKLVTL